MSTFRAFQTGLEAGQKQAKVKREDDARMKASEAYGMGNYEGAVTGLMGAGLTQDADAYQRAGAQKRQTEAEQRKIDANKRYSGALQNPDRATGLKNLRGEAAQEGNIDLMQWADEQSATLNDQQKAQFGEGMNFLAQTAESLKQYSPETRAAEAIKALQNSPYANPQVMAQIEQAGADGLITNDEIDDFVKRTLSVKDRLELAKAAKPKYTNVTTRDGVIAYNDADPNQTVNLGQAPLPASQQGDGGGAKPPSGYVWTGNPDQPLAPITGGPADPKSSGVDIDPKIIGLETTQSNKWMPIQNNFADIQNQFDRINTLAANKNSASDLGLIVSFTKMLDPGSVAREGEVQLTQQAAGAIDQAMIWLPRLQGGKTLLPDNVRQMYVDAARDMYGSYEKTYQRLAQSTQKRATDYGLSPDRIMMGYDAPAPMKPKAAQDPAMQMGVRAYAKQTGIPAEAITEFLSNPATPQEIAEFNEAFQHLGPNQAEAILKAMQGGR